MDLPGMLASHPAVERLTGEALRARRAVARGSVGSSSPLLAAAVARASGRPALLIVAHTDEADDAEATLTAAGVPTVLLPALQSLPGESHVAAELLALRLGVVRRALTWTGRALAGTVVIAPVQALMQPVPSPKELEDELLEIATGDTRGPGAVASWLAGAGYTRVDAVEEPGDYAVRGGIIDVFAPGGTGTTETDDQGRAVSAGGTPVRLDFFGDVADKIAEIDLDTMGVDRTVHAARFIRVSERSTAGGGAGAGAIGSVNFVDLLPRETVALLHELMEITEQGRGYFERLTGSHDVLGLPAVLRAVVQRCAAVIEVTALGQYTGNTAGAGPGTDPLIELPVGPPVPLPDEVPEAIKELSRLARGEDAGGAPTAPLGVTIFCNTAMEQVRLGELIDEHAPEARGVIASAVQHVHAGFCWREGERTRFVLPYHDLLKRFMTRRTRGLGGTGGAARLKAGRAMDTFLDLQVGDYVVHAEHGIARFTGLRFVRPQDEKTSVDERLRGGTATRASREEPEEFLTLEFAGSSKLHVPATKVDLVTKYIGGFKGKPPLSTLGGDRWKNQKARVTESIRDLAAELLRVRAAREHLPGIRFPGDTTWQREFEAQFPFDETEDQLAALSEIKRDMTSPRPMDRLLCGDVGYGKTELAIRGAFKAVEYGKQVAVLVPTTVLAEQHERTFKDRFAGYPFIIESISRFKTDAQIRDVLERLGKGQVDILIGTHRLLSQDVRFADLGLVIIDEEQRFGVEHKERLLSLRLTVDVLTLSATPIPRTLHMSLLGLRDISSLTTAPGERRAVVTEVIPYNAQRVAQAISRELAREGQVFYVHNRVHNILSVANEVQKLAPGAKIVVGHGQMNPHELEEVMLTFMRRKADVLVSTTIIESGIDIPTANTMIIADSDRFGLADLHQLRGRVGRGKNRGYCYLLLPDDRPVKERAKQRLKAIEQYSMLGAGFKIAMRDLEIRGAGNILGPEQSGHIAAVGYDMYCRLLERAVKELRNEVTLTPSETSVEIGVRGVIPKAYIPSDQRRLEAYRRLALAGSPEELARVRADLKAAYGEPPPTTEKLLQLAEIRAGARLLGVRTIVVREKDVIVRTSDGPKTAAALEGAPGRVTLLPVSRPDELPEVYFRPSTPAGLEPLTLLAILRSRLGGATPAAEAASPPAPAAADVPKAKHAAPPNASTLRSLKRITKPGRS